MLSGFENDNFVIDSQVINSILPYGLHGEIFRSAGDYFTYCISSDKKRVYNNLLSFKADTCQVKFKGRVLAAPRKLPGFYKISGYEQLVKMGPAMLMTFNQMNHILDRTIHNFPEFEHVRKKALLENQPSKDNLLKENLMVKLAEGTKREDRLMISNSMMAINEDIQMMIADAIQMAEDMDVNLQIVDFFSACTSIICFVLGLFQLILTISANIKDSMWELGVLRSMGCTRGQIIRVMVYELVSNTLSAMTLGYISGTMVSVFAIAQFHTLVELPLRVKLPISTMVVVGICALASLGAGAKYGTTELFRRNIASILKGC